MQPQPLSEVIEADPTTVRRWLDQGEAVLVDVRETSEYDQEHIPGSMLVPLSVFEPELFPRISEKKVVIHCAVGRRSAVAALQLMKAGHVQAINLEGGLEAWKQAGLATEIRAVPPEPVEPAPAPPRAGRKRSDGSSRQQCDVHPGEVLRVEFLEPLGLGLDRAARDIGIAEPDLDAITGGRRPVDADTALRLARYFGTSDEFWLRLQMCHDLDQARRVSQPRIRREVKPVKAAA